MSTGRDGRGLPHGGLRLSAGALKVVALLAMGLAIAAIASIGVTMGTARLSLFDVIDALFAFNGSREHLVITAIRLPRVAAGLLAGAGLSVAGAIMQAATRNPLASPDLLGINAGAAFCVVLAMAATGVVSDIALVGCALLGAGVAAVMVYLLGSSGPSSGSPVRLVLAGAMLSAFLASLTTAILIVEQSTLDQIRLWAAGSLSGRTAAQTTAVAPFILIGLAGAMVFRRQITTLSLGGDIARALGQEPAIWRAVLFALVILLAGSAVALAGPIGFVGLVVPHMARLIVGVDYRWILPFSALGGALLLALADLAGRTLHGPTFPVGVTMALIGGPFFVWLARQRLQGAA